MGIDLTLILTATIAGMLAAIPGILALRGQYKKQSADASASNVATAIKLKRWMEEEIEELKARCETMEAEIAKQDTNITELRRRVRVLSMHANALIEQITEMGIEPVVSIEALNHVSEVKR